MYYCLAKIRTCLVTNLIVTFLLINFEALEISITIILPNDDIHYITNFYYHIPITDINQSMHATREYRRIQ